MEQVPSHEVQYYHYVDLDQAIGLWEADEVLLMEMLEDSTATGTEGEDDAEELSRVIRSLEAEIGGATPTAMGDGESMAEPPSEHDGMLMDLDGYGGVAFGNWPEVSPVVGSWCVYYTESGEGSIGGCEGRDHHLQYYYADQEPVDQMYIPLWD